MPDPVTHGVFSAEVMTELPEEIRSAVDVPVFGRALQGPDPWSVIGFYGGKNKRYADRSAILHKTHTGAFLSALAEEAKRNPSSPVFSVLLGTVCHYCLDKWAHPYIICKGGFYDGTEKTRSQIGGHVRLERAIDSYYIRRNYGVAPWRFPLASEVFALKKYPESLRQPLDSVYDQVYGWEAAFDRINASLRDERLFYGLMQDPCGLIRLLLRPISRGNRNYSIYSYYRQDIDESKTDYLNRKRRPWRHPFDQTLVSCDSFFDLYDQAKAEAVEMICRAYDWVFRDVPHSLTEIFGNSNYSTGFDCADARNGGEAICEPLHFDPM